MTTWAEQAAAWERRVAQYGPTRAIFHLKHDPATFEAVTDAHAAITIPPLIAQLRPSDTWLLDYGCGWGRWTTRLAEATGRPVVGVDVTPALIAEAVRRVREAPCHTQVAFAHIPSSGECPAVPDTVPVIWAFTVLSAVTDPDLLAATLAEWRRVLAPDGLVYLIDNTSKVNGRPVRSRWSVSRTVVEYQALFADWCPLTVLGDYVDLGEVNTIFAGRCVA